MIGQGARNGASRGRRRLARPFPASMCPVCSRKLSWPRAWRSCRRPLHPGRRRDADGAAAVPAYVPGPRARLRAPHRCAAPDQAPLAGEYRRAERPRSRWVGCGPDLPCRRPAEGRSWAGGPAEGVTQSRSREGNLVSTRSFATRLPHFLPSIARPASRPGPGRCSSRRRRCEAPRDCGSVSCRAGS
jgi:hypothetical protein